MTEWYLPMTVIPGLGLIILSTSNLLLSLSAEIKTMINTSLEVGIIKRKLSQLKLLNITLVLFYSSVALLLTSTLTNGMFDASKPSQYILVVAIALSLLALLLLVIYSFKAVHIRQDQFKNKLK